MKNIFYLLFSFIIFSACKSNQTNQQNFDFLIGNWTRTNEKEGKMTLENWQKENPTTYLGHSFTLKNNDTIWQEYITLIKENNKWYYKVKMEKETTSTDFILIEFGLNKFSVENKYNDFPKVIKYWKDKDLLMAEITDGKTTIPFQFKNNQIFSK